MKTLDITIDFETCALTPTAAVMSLGAVAWDRYGNQTPFISQDGCTDFFARIDLTSCFTEGFTIDRDTQEWWQKQSEEAKKNLLKTDAVDIRLAIQLLFDYIEGIKGIVGAESVCLWSQGSDFDIAILRNICYVLGMELPIRYTNFRDHRTVCMEMADVLLDDDAFENLPAKKPCKAYELVERYKDGEGVTHTPVYDCKKSIYSTWQMMQKMRELLED